MITINIDGAARGNPGPAGYGVLAADKDGKELQQAFGYIGEQTNNCAEYAALLAALELALSRRWPRVNVISDSQLLVRQIRGQYKVKNQMLARLHRRALQLIARLEKFAIEHVTREQNKEADRLANKAVDEQRSEPAAINPFRVSRKT